VTRNISGRPAKHKRKRDWHLIAWAAFTVVAAGVSVGLLLVQLLRQLRVIG
jgi:hypothetical protein